MFDLCYGLYSCSPHWDDHLCFREALGTFTTELAHVRSPSHESAITTWVNRQLPGRDFHPLETQPYGLHTFAAKARRCRAQREAPPAYAGVAFSRLLGHACPNAKPG
jgi:hypothetical protein